MKESKLEDFYNEVAAFLSKDGISDDPAILDSYAQDESFCDRLAPAFITWPTTTRDVQLIIQSATKFAIPLVPVSSGPGFRQHADTVPNQEGSVVVDLSKMNHILRIDRINRVVMVEAGVTFAQLLPELTKQDLRLLQPLCPRGNKSVVTSALEREPTLIPRYHWDASDPLLCMELVFGTGDVFRTGSAAGPGSIEEQLATGQAQKNPLGPAQFNLFQTIQGAQGSLGIVTWATLKCELQPTQQKILYFQVADLRLLLDFAYELLKFRMGDEMFLMNKLAFASLIKADPGEFQSLLSSLEDWVLVVILAGRGKFAADKIAYLEGDLTDIAQKHNLTILTSLSGIDDAQMMATLHSTSDTPWTNRYKGACQSIFFLTTLDRAPTYNDQVVQLLASQFADISDMGVYIQPETQGCNCHLEFQLYYNPNNPTEVDTARTAFTAISKELMLSGAFFSRPYGEWADVAFDQMAPESSWMLQKVKDIFDPNKVLKPRVLCFKQEGA